MSSDLVIKVCVVGPSRCGKTLLCKTLAEQASSGDYEPTAGVRIQVIGRQIGQDHLKVQLWDLSGDPQYQPVWPVLAQDVDGVLLLLDPDHPEQERELEQFYVRFAQPHNLTMKQCCVLAVSNAGSSLAGNWTGLRGKLNKLQAGLVEVSRDRPEQGRQAALELLDKLLAGCVAQKKDKLERAVLGT